MTLEKNINIIDLKIFIPQGMGRIPTKKLLLFKRGFTNANKPIYSFSKIFNYLEDINGYSYEDLLDTKGIGKKTVDIIWEWFSSFHTDSFENLYDELIYADDKIKLNKIHHSFYVQSLFNRYEIRNLEDLKILDSLIVKDAKLETKIALFELRTLTLFKDEDNQISTRTNHDLKQINFYSYIDSFFLTVDSKSLALSQNRWGKEKLITLKDVGNLFGLTRERARQVLTSIKKEFLAEYFYDFDDIYYGLSTIYLDDLFPLSFDRINDTKDYIKKYDQGFYKKFFKEIIHPIPFYSDPNNILRNKDDSAAIVNTKNKLLKVDQIKAREYLKSFNLDEAINVLNYARNSNGSYDLLVDSNKYYFVRDSEKYLSWEYNFANLIAFVHENKKVPRSDDRFYDVSEKELKIGQWLRTQKRRHKVGTLSVSRFEKINELIPGIFDKKRTKRVSWLESYTDYKSFIHKYKDEPRQGSNNYDEARIARWASFNRQLYHGGIRTNKPLTENQLELLKKIQFDFDFLKPRKVKKPIIPFHEKIKPAVEKIKPAVEKIKPAVEKIKVFKGRKRLTKNGIRIVLTDRPVRICLLYTSPSPRD